MKLKSAGSVLVTFWILFGFVRAAAAQVALDTSHMNRIGELARHWQTQLGPRTNRLSGAARNFLYLGKQWEKIKGLTAVIPSGETAGVSAETQSQLALPQLLGQSAPVLAPGHPASQPNLGFTRFSGAVQSETSTAWCGKEAVVGFNDSGSFWATGGFFPTGGQSLNGYAVSTNSGGKFTYKGFPAVGPPNTIMVGDPVLACTSPANFLYASLYEDNSSSALHRCPDSSSAGNSDISLSVSTDGGNTFGAPAPAIAKDACFHFLDKPWMTVDPSNPRKVVVTYTDFDSEAYDGGTGNDCGPAGSDIPRTAIELVTSTDGGATWSAPTVVQEVCGAPFVQGSQVAIDQTGKIYVAWESFAGNFYTREIDIASSTDGVMFSAPIKVSAVHAVGDGDFSYGIQGFIRDFEFPSLVIGKGKKNSGSLYIAWNDGDRRVNDAWVQLIQFGFGIGDGKYGFSDVLFSSSTNGSTWSAPVMVNQASRTPADHYQPGVATDKTGAIAVCWYDRRRDANNFLIDRFCGRSTNGGVKWTNTKITPINFPSVVNQDLLIAFDYMGDYDTVTSDATNAAAGFLGGFVNAQAGNQNVQVNKY